ncbi:unnamed protein product [Dibothriocephalus latus]|uniref:Uncharacterized protein n=1 Tax=Dibothriocephalus latus TaxID=60516 RepID=A0A3P7LGV9_DIBLA|nr:unnamed protein product [Dibothriocephalus latus]
MAAISLLNRVTGSSDATYLKLDESDLSQRHLQMRTDVYESIGHSSMSVYVNSWYVGHSQAVGPRRPRVDCAGDDVPATFFTPASDFAASNGVRQSSTNQQSAVNAAAAPGVPPSVSGWQTPDSGACSCSTNDASGSAATGPGIPLTSNVHLAPTFLIHGFHLLPLHALLAHLTTLSTPASMRPLCPDGNHSAISPSVVNTS